MCKKKKTPQHECGQKTASYKRKELRTTSATYLIDEELISLTYILKKTTKKQKKKDGISLVIQWLGLCASTTGGMGSIPGQGTGIPHASKWGQKKKQTNQKNTRKG